MLRLGTYHAVLHTCIPLLPNTRIVANRYLGLQVVWVILSSSTLPAQLTVIGCSPTCLAVVGSLDPCLFFFFLIFLFFFFLFTRLLASEISLGEEDETEEDLASEEGEEDIAGEEGEEDNTGEEGEGST
jgi:hypothetical protein